MHCVYTSSFAVNYGGISSLVFLHFLLDADYAEEEQDSSHRHRNYEL